LKASQYEPGFLTRLKARFKSNEESLEMTCCGFEVGKVFA